MSALGNAAKLFSGKQHAALYAISRPHYPSDLYNRIYNYASGSARHEAVDVASGSGQAAVELSKTFKHVTAIDASAEQLANAEQRPNITYMQACAEELGDIFKPQSIDLVAVAQGLHWFDIPKFYAEAQRILRPNGTLACWGYGLLQFSGNGGTGRHALVDNPKAAADANKALLELYSGVLDAYWDDRRRIVEKCYEGFDKLALKYFQHAERQRFLVDRRYTVSQLLAYMRSWSSYQTYLKATNQQVDAPGDPILEFKAKLLDIMKCRHLDDDELDQSCVIAYQTPHFMVLAKEPLPM